MHNDKLLLHKYYENLSSRVTFLTISDNCKPLTALKFNLKYYFNAKTLSSVKTEPSPLTPLLSPNPIACKTSRPQAISQPPVVNRQPTIRKNSLRLPVSTPPSTSPVSNLIPPQKPQCVATIHVSKQKQLIAGNKSAIGANASSTINNNNPISNNNGVGFHLKNLSKKLNIKSWFHSSANAQNSPQMSLKGATMKKAGTSLSPFSYTDPMKISISEPMISEIANGSLSKIKK